MVEALLASASALDWWNAYDPSEPAGRNVAERTSACLLTGPGGDFTPRHGRAGFFFLRQGVEYAPHRHRPQEIYAVVAGCGRFWVDGEGWRSARAGDVVHTPSSRWHAAETPDAPALILWCWIGEDFEGRPEFRNATGAMPA